MGRQIGLVATQADEATFLDFLRSTTEIAILPSSFLSPENPWVTSFHPDLKYSQYYIWNKRYPWIPQFKVNDLGKYYVTNNSGGPVIEISRCDHGNLIGGVYRGRLYYDGYFCAPGNQVADPVAYKEFNDWFSRIQRWVRKNGKQKEKGAPYYLPDAMTKSEFKD